MQAAPCRMKEQQSWVALGKNKFYQANLKPRHLNPGCCTLSVSWSGFLWISAHETWLKVCQECQIGQLGAELTCPKGGETWSKSNTNIKTCVRVCQDRKWSIPTTSNSPQFCAAALSSLWDVLLMTPCAVRPIPWIKIFRFALWLFQ